MDEVRRHRFSRAFAPGVRPLLILCCPALVVLIGSGAQGQDLGREWTSLPAEEAAIILTAPGLETSVSRHMRSTAASQSYTIEIGQWTGPAARHAKAITAYYEVSPGMYFRSEIDPRRFVKGVGAFKEKSLDFSDLQVAQNALGRIKFRRFSFDNVQCVGFSQAWSPVESADPGEKQLSGYYCADPDEVLGAETAERVVAAIRPGRPPTLSGNVVFFDGARTGAKADGALDDMRQQRAEALRRWIQENRNEFDGRLNGFWQHRKSSASSGRVRAVSHEVIGARGDDFLISIEFQEVLSSSWEFSEVETFVVALDDGGVRFLDLFDANR